MNNLFHLKPDDSATVFEILDESPMRRRFFDLGLIKGTTVQCVGESPSKDPKAYLIRGAVIALRREDAEKILIENIIRGEGNGVNP